MIRHESHVKNTADPSDRQPEKAIQSPLHNDLIRDLEQTYLPSLLDCPQIGAVHLRRLMQIKHPTRSDIVTLTSR